MDVEFNAYLKTLREQYDNSRPPKSGSDGEKYGWLLAYASSNGLGRASVNIEWDVDTVDEYLATNAVEWIKRGAEVSWVLSNFPCSGKAFMEATKIAHEADQKLNYDRECKLVERLRTCADVYTKALGLHPSNPDGLENRKKARLELNTIAFEIDYFDD